MGMGEEYQRDEMLFSSHHIRGTWYSHDIPGDINFHHLFKVVFATDSHSSITIFFSFPNLFYGIESLSLALGEYGMGWVD